MVDDDLSYTPRSLWGGYTARCMRCGEPATGMWPDLDPDELSQGLGTWGDVFCSLNCASETTVQLNMVATLGDRLNESYGLLKIYRNVFQWGDRIYVQRFRAPTSEQDATMRDWLTVARFTDTPLWLRAFWDTDAGRMSAVTYAEGDTSRDAWEAARRVAALLLDQPGVGRPPRTTKIPLDVFPERAARVEAEYRATFGRPPRLDELAAELDVSARTIRNYRKRRPDGERRQGESGK